MPFELVEVTEREPLRRKARQTTGGPLLLVIGSYRMGFDIAPQDRGSRLTVYIDHDDPPGARRLAGKLLGVLCA